MAATLDPRKAHLVRYHGEIMALYTWINDERAIVLSPFAARMALRGIASWKVRHISTLTKTAIQLLA